MNNKIMLAFNEQLLALPNGPYYRWSSNNAFVKCSVGPLYYSYANQTFQ